MPNALANEKSPYLLQHANNPVDWLPWGEEAFGRAREEEKPIFLSVGYSTCHWCHVMEEESFENEETARLMNEHFVNVKVDREERPDVDLTYMTFVQATTGQGGWPMSVWLTPDLLPFLGGTYFPPSDRQGRAGFPRVLRQIAELWREKREGLVEQGERLVKLLKEQGVGEGEAVEADRGAVLDRALAQFARSFDEKRGGFGGAPKFPRPAVLNLLLCLHRRYADRSEGSVALEMAQTTLVAMANGGIYDHLGGGFHRYAVDRYWHVPHFEKMLYDQAQLAVSLIEVFEITGRAEYAEVARDVFQYVLRDMTSPEGGFYSAEDADSFLDETRSAHGEGAFYVWDFEEITRHLGGEGPAAEIFCEAYGVEEKGNIRPESDPMRELTGKNVLFRAVPDAAIAEGRGIPEEEVRASLERSRGLLFEERGKRPRPHLDDKIITAWNGLMISAFARGYGSLGVEEYRAAALRAATFLREQLVAADSGRLLRSYREGPGAVQGFASDYAFTIQGLLDLYDAVLDFRWLEWAVDLQEVFDETCFDAGRRGYLSVSDEGEHSILALKEDHDGAEPAPGSVAALNLVRFFRLMGNEAWRSRAEDVVAGVLPMLSEQPMALPQMAVALEALDRPPGQVVIAAGGDFAEAGPVYVKLIRERRAGIPVILLDSEEAREFFGARSEALRAMEPIDGKTTVYLCENFSCQQPVTDAEGLDALLAGESRAT